MKNKLTVAIEKDLIPKAKSYARSHGTSLSEIIEKTFRSLPEGRGISFSGRWRGKFTAARKNEDRFKKLAEKYL
ncbi:MAG TPA: hypothetical protein DCZ94_12475 [Lentisphaeria bacterium]|nr:MAG: hypothetical protein A2X48_03925 [Lentisphaerae bacterium GWF2_49_21]HBC87762.1 hypothetical protein [Lentisphaeria bacterium]